MIYFYIWLLIINVVAFAMAGIDKHKAKKHKWRIRESSLIGAAIIGGSIGLLTGMFIFRHKTKHAKFMVGVPVILIVQIIILVFWLL